MKRKTSKRKPAAIVRGKYAAAARKGVKVVVHTKTGDQVRILKRHPDGTIVWEFPPAKA